MDNVIVIDSAEALDKYSESIFKDISEAVDKKLQIDKNAFPPIVVKISSNEDEPYIDAEWMSVFLKFQSTIINSVEIGLGRSLTDAEKASLQIKVYVKKGSRIFEILSDISGFFDSELVEVLPNMSIGQILSVIIPITAAYLGGKYISSQFKAKITMHKDELSHQEKTKEQEILQLNNQLLAQGLTESESERILREKDRHETELAIIQQLDRMLDNEKKEGISIAKSIRDIPGIDSLEVNGTTISKSDLIEMAKGERHKYEAKRVTVNDWFAIKAIKFNESQNEIQVENPKYNLKSFAIPPEVFNDEAWKRVNERKKIHLIFGCFEKNGKLEVDPSTAITVLLDDLQECDQ